MKQWQSMGVRLTSNVSGNRREECLFGGGTKEWLFGGSTEEWQKASWHGGGCISVHAKQTKEPAGPNTMRTATIPCQGLSIDFTFSGAHSKNKKRDKKFLGHNGETCWILITDHKSRMKHGEARINTNDTN